MSSSSSPSSSSSIPTESGKTSTSPPLWQSSPSQTVARVASLVEFIQKYTWLADLYFVEFYSENLQSLFPPEWIQALLFDKTLTLAEFDTFMGTQKLGPQWPDSLKEFLTEAKALSIPREFNHEEYSSLPRNEPVRLNPVFTSGMRPKKIHEVGIMANYIKNEAVKKDIKHVVDFGSGQGYLSQVLAFAMDLNVVAIDNDEHQTLGSQHRQTKITTTLEKKKHSCKGSLHHMTCHVAPETFSEILCKSPVPMSAEKKWLICGLHACGDLSPTMIRSFIKSDAEVLVNVGCCYHFMSNKTDDSDNHGFPMSRQVIASGLTMGNRAKNLAAQALYRWSEQTEQDLNVFVRHHFRAILQVILKERGWASQPDSQDIFVVGTLPKETFDSFGSYARACLDKFNLADQVSDEDLRAYEQRFEGLHEVLTLCWSLRAMMSQVMESLLLLDRLLYLEEFEGVKASLFPIFDPFESPRNMVLVASKS